MHLNALFGQSFLSWSGSRQDRILTLLFMTGTIRHNQITDFRQCSCQLALIAWPSVQHVPSSVNDIKGRANHLTYLIYADSQNALKITYSSSQRWRGVHLAFRDQNVAFSSARRAWLEPTAVKDLMFKKQRSYPLGTGCVARLTEEPETPGSISGPATYVSCKWFWNILYGHSRPLIHCFFVCLFFCLQTNGKTMS